MQRMQKVAVVLFLAMQSCSTGSTNQDALEQVQDHLQAGAYYSAFETAKPTLSYGSPEKQSKARSMLEGSAAFGSEVLRYYENKIPTVRNIYVATGIDNDLKLLSTLSNVDRDRLRFLHEKLEERVVQDVINGEIVLSENSKAAVERFPGLADPNLKKTHRIAFIRDDDRYTCGGSS